MMMFMMMMMFIGSRQEARKKILIFGAFLEEPLPGLSKSYGVTIIECRTLTINECRTLK